MFPVADVIPPRRRPYVTIALIAVHALVFILEVLLSDRLPRFVAAFGVVPAFFSWPDVLSSMFLHAGWVQFAANTIALWLFGESVEDRLGRARFLVFYVACGAVAALGHVALDANSTTPLVGPSGAIAGVMGTYFALYPQSRMLTVVFPIAFFDVVEVPATVYLGIWLMVQLASGAGSPAYAGGDTAILSLASGFATGAAGGWFWGRRIPYW